MCLGEGTGAVAAMPILDMANAVYREMSTFEDIAIDAYQELK
jgi:nicotinate-nucleotide--dimethylbenzimidazole phosphoribosyltransferase